MTACCRCCRIWRSLPMTPYLRPAGWRCGSQIWGRRWRYREGVRVPALDRRRHHRRRPTRRSPRQHRRRSPERTCNQRYSWLSQRGFRSGVLAALSLLQNLAALIDDPVARCARRRPHLRRPDQAKPTSSSSVAPTARAPASPRSGITKKKSPTAATSTSPSVAEAARAARANPSAARRSPLARA